MLLVRHIPSTCTHTRTECACCSAVPEHVWRYAARYSLSFTLYPSDFPGELPKLSFFNRYKAINDKDNQRTVVVSTSTGTRCQVKPVTVKDLPPGRLHNVIIAPRRSGQGQRDRAQPQPRTRTGGVRKRPPSTNPPRVTAAQEGAAEEKHQEPQSRAPIPLRSMPSSSSFSDNRDEYSPLSRPQSQSQSLASVSAAVAPGDEAVAAAVAAGARAAEAEFRGAAKAECCRNGQSSRCGRCFAVVPSRFVSVLFVDVSLCCTIKGYRFLLCRRLIRS